MYTRLCHDAERYDQMRQQTLTLLRLHRSAGTRIGRRSLGQIKLSTKYPLHMAQEIVAH